MQLQHRFAVSFLQILQLPLVLRAHVLGLGTKGAFHVPLVIVHPAGADFRRAVQRLISSFIVALICFLRKVTPEQDFTVPLQRRSGSLVWD